MPEPDTRPHPNRTLVFALRRMAAHGLNDAHAASAMLTQFGLHYRRPLILLRVTIAELERASARTIAVAPCCAARVTTDEANLLRALELASDEPRAAHLLLAETLATEDCLGALTTVQALAQACRDLGRPLALFAARAG